MTTAMFMPRRTVKWWTTSGGAGFSGLPAFALQPPGCNFSVQLEEGQGPPGSFTFANCGSDDRLDQIAQTRIRLRKSFGRSWSVEGFYNWTDWSSDVKEFDFNRHFVGFAATFRR